MRSQSHPLYKLGEDGPNAVVSLPIVKLYLTKVKSFLPMVKSICEAPSIEDIWREAASDSRGQGSNSKATL